MHADHNLFIYLILYFKRVTQLAISYSSLRPSLKQQQQYVQYIQNHTVINIVIKTRNSQYVYDNYKFVVRFDFICLTSRFLNEDIVLADLTAVGNLFQI